MTYEFERIGTVSTSMVFHQDRKAGDMMTVAVVGIPRGGTTMVAAVVDALGVDMGPREDMSKFNSFEDQTMNQSDLAVRFPYVTSRNQAHLVWGWKDPTGISSVRNILFALRHLHVIVVFRDMVATIQGELQFDEAHGIEPRRSFAQLADMTVHWWTELMEFVTHSEIPTMLVSYERAMREPDLFIQELVAFLGGDPSVNQLTEARSRISTKGGYLLLEQHGSEE